MRARITAGLVGLAACGRVGFTPVGNASADANGDGGGGQGDSVTGRPCLPIYSLDLWVDDVIVHTAAVTCAD